MIDPLSEPPSLTFRYENSRPVELADLTTSLQAVARRFSRYVTQSGFELEEESVKLYVRRISEGSIVVDLTNVLVAHGSEIASAAGGGAATATAFAQANAVVTFSKNLRDGLNYLVGRGAKPSDMPASELKDLAKIVEPVAKDGKGNMHITASDGATVQVSVSFNSLEANTIQNRAEREMADRREPVQTAYRRVLMYWHQASKTPGSRSDKAVIEKISDKPLKVIFEDDTDIKAKMLSGKDNPFNIGFLVDVELITKQGRPVAYEVSHLYEVLNEEDTDID
jgi:hypothetical protein